VTGDPAAASAVEVRHVPSTRILSGLAALGAAGCLFACLARFRGPDAGHAAGWRLYALALLLLLAAAWPWRGRLTARTPVTRREAVLLLLVLALGAAFRLHRLDSLPHGVWFDEAQNGLVAMRILAEPSYRPVFVPGTSQLPALAFYCFAFFIRLMGPDILALRAATTLVGMLSILAVWALGRELLGRRAGLIAAALLALSRWHVTFSRFAVTQVSVTLFMPLVLWLFLRSQRRRSPRDAVLCGIALGLGLQSYYAMLAAPLLLLACFALGLARGEARGRGAAGLLLVTLGTAAFVYAPILQYARTHPAEYAQRLTAASFVRSSSPLEALSLLVRPGPRRGEAWTALRANAAAHARMFHLEGDHNGRHNLPGAPMLDPVTGLLFAVGLLWCLARPLEPRRAVPLLAFVAMMAPGVLSLTFEAPQGARTLGAVPFVALMAAVPLAWLARALADRGGRGPLLAGCAVAMAVAVAAGWSWHVFFHRQLRDASAWESFSTPETRIAEVVRSEGRDADVYVTPTLLGGPTETFLLGGPLRALPFERGRDLPLEPRGRAALLFFTGSEQETASLVHELYPHAVVEAFGAPGPDGSQGEPVLWIARVPAEAIAALRGWEIVISRTGQAPVVQATLASAWDWDRMPVPPPFTARVQGVLRVPGEERRAWAVSGTPVVTLAIDGEQLLRGSGRNEAELSLARGLHRVDLALDVPRRGLRTALSRRLPAQEAPEPVPPGEMFSPRLTPGGLLGAYHAGGALEGAPSLRRIDPQVAFYFHLLPLPRPFSVRWTGSVYAEAPGRYAFGTASIDESSVAVDGRELLTNPETNRYLESEIDLEQGWHTLEVRYRAVRDYSQVYLRWRTPGGGQRLVPSAVLRPPGPSGRLLARDAPAPEAPRPVVPAPRAVEAPASRAEELEQAAPLRALSQRELPLGGGTRMASARDGRLFVLSPGERRVIAVSPGGAVEALGGGSPRLADPSDLAVSPDGRLHVLDAAGSIVVFSPRLAVERVIDLRPLQVYNPRGLAVTASEILIADTGGGRVLVCDRDGRLLRQVGRPGKGRGELSDPVDVASDRDGRLVVVDAGNGRIQRFASDGSAEAAWPRAGDRPGIGAERADVDPDGTVWVAGGGAAEVWRLPAAGPPRRHPLPDGLRPEGLATAGNGRLFLVVPAPTRLVEMSFRR
jgi:4-amino-4-deoxy-L-arabinose transferase-like glycosyltransferase/sugar lactone lactonase YvrE